MNFMDEQSNLDDLAALVGRLSNPAEVGIGGRLAHWTKVVPLGCIALATLIFLTTIALYLRFFGNMLGALFVATVLGLIMAIGLTRIALLVVELVVRRIIVWRFHL